MIWEAVDRSEADRPGARRIAQERVGWEQGESPKSEANHRNLKTFKNLRNYSDFGAPKPKNIETPKEIQ